MQKTDVIIQVADEQSMGGENDDMEITVVGTLEMLENGYELCYTEYEGELQNCLTTVTVQNGRSVTMTRVGSYATELMIEKGKRHSCRYNTPYGELMLGVFGTAMESDMTENGGALKIEYTIDFNTGLAAKNRLTITARARDGQKKGE